MTAVLHNYDRSDQSTPTSIKMFHWLQSIVDEEHQCLSVDVNSTERPNNLKVFVSGISPKGDYIYIYMKGLYQQHWSNATEGKKKTQPQKPKPKTMESTSWRRSR